MLGESFAEDLFCFGECFDFERALALFFGASHDDEMAGSSLLLSSSPIFSSFGAFGINSAEDARVSTDSDLLDDPDLISFESKISCEASIFFCGTAGGMFRTLAL